MLGRCQQRLCRGLLAALQHQQQCLQLEVLHVVQRVRNKSSSGFKGGQPPLSAKQRAYQLRHAVVNKALERIEPTPSIASLAASLDATPTPSAPAAAENDTTTSAAAAESGPATSSSPSSAAAAASDAATSAGDSSSSSTADSSSESSWRPAWLDRLMDYPRQRRPAPAKPSPLQGNAPPAAATAAAAAAGEGSSTDDKQQRDKEWQHINAGKNVSLDDYKKNYLRYDPPEQMRKKDGSQTGKLPTRPPQLGNPNAPPHLQTDYARISRARHKQQFEIISSMSAEDKRLANEHLDAAIKDWEWIKRVAQAAQKPPGMVLDMLRQVKRHRTYFLDLATFGELGGDIQDYDDEQEMTKILTRMKQKREADLAARALVNRDPDNCELRKWSGAMLSIASIGKRTLCLKTGVPYSECCGALFGSRRHKQYQRKGKHQYWGRLHS